jgi:hypothetical protein
MSTERAHAASRSITRLGIETPLLVPSFSSRGFPEVAPICAGLRGDLYGVCLVSAFDLASRRLPIKLADVADLVVLDSGVYETKPVAIAADGYHPPDAGLPWQRSSYREFLEAVGEDANVLAVSFDHYGPVDQQIELAREDFACAPSAAQDFLLKPLAIDGRLDQALLREHANALGGFAVVGATEIELGGSLLERCRSLVAIRDLLGATGSLTPIHVFGTITPGSLLAYFLCGADVFDGLNWLRFVYDVAGLRPFAESALDDGQWDRPDGVRFLDQSRRNLRFLHRLQEAMRLYARTGDFRALADSFPAARAAARAAAAAGSRFRAEGLE